MFMVDDKVEKYKGTYRAIGTVIAVGKTSAGEIRYLVEYDIPKGLCHIHSDSDLRSHSSTG